MEMAKTLNASSLRSTVGSLKDITIFAPRNAAFYPNRYMLGGLSSEQLTGLLSYHIVKGVYYSNQLKENQTLPTVQGGSLKVRMSTNGTFLVNNASLSQTDFLTKNGVLHVIDSILMLPNSTPSNSTLSNSTLSNSTLSNSTLSNSTLSNSTLSNSTLSKGALMRVLRRRIYKEE
jgi:uncharacterized surface protein with fasciclin (FAS1) repeats